jgi:hypothetical protein
MKKLIRYLSSTLLAATLLAASLAGATTFAVSGSNNPSAYLATSSAYLDVNVPVLVQHPASPWVNSTGPWMTYNNTDQVWPMDANSGNLPGMYFYLTTFDLTGLNPLTAVLKGSWASDNGGQMFLNDFSHAVSTNNSYLSLTSFDITSGFQQGLNSLLFMVKNDPLDTAPFSNPTAILVNIDSATANPVPEPGTMMLLGAGFLGLAIYGKRRKNA